MSLIGVLLGPMFPLVVEHSRKVFPPFLLNGCIGWILGIGTSGSAVLPFITGLMASRFGIGSLQPLYVLSVLSARRHTFSYVIFFQDNLHDGGDGGLLGSGAEGTASRGLNNWASVRVREGTNVRVLCAFLVFMAVSLHKNVKEGRFGVSSLPISHDNSMAAVSPAFLSLRGPCDKCDQTLGLPPGRAAGRG